jgi:hypothetical protein
MVPSTFNYDVDYTILKFEVKGGKYEVLNESREHYACLSHASKTRQVSCISL